MHGNAGLLGGMAWLLTKSFVNHGISDQAASTVGAKHGPGRKLRNYVLHTSHPALMSPNKRKRLYRGRDVLSKHHS